MKSSPHASGSALLRVALVLGGGLILGGGVAACAASADPPPPFERTPTPAPPAPLRLVDGVILEGGFNALFDEALTDWVGRIEVVHAGEARGRWGEEARSGAILITRVRGEGDEVPAPGHAPEQAGTPSAEASLRQRLEDHLPLLEMAYARDPRPEGAMHIPHLLGEGDPAWARAIVFVDGEIPPRSRPLIRSEPLATEPPAAWLGELGDMPARGFTLRSIRGAEAAALYGNVAWFGVIHVETASRSGD